MGRVEFVCDPASRQRSKKRKKRDQPDQTRQEQACGVAGKGRKFNKLLRHSTNRGPYAHAVGLIVCKVVRRTRAIEASTCLHAKFGLSWVPRARGNGESLTLFY